MAEPTEIGIAVIGFGWMGQAHSRSYRNIPVYFPEAGLKPRLVTIADSVQDRIDLAIDNFGFANGTTDWRTIMDDPSIDIVDITAPNAMHQELAEAAAAAGKHVFCEKPVGLTFDATAAIEYAARTAGVITGVRIQLPLGATRATHPPAHPRWTVR